MQQRVDNQYCPWGVILIWNSSQILFSKAYWNFTYDVNSPAITLDTRFDLASVTKWLSTWLLSCHFVQKWLFQLEDYAQKFIPDFPYKEIKLYHLLTHSAGYDKLNFKYNHHMSKEEFMERVIQTNIIYKPWAQMLYSDIGYIIMWKVLEIATSKNLWSLFAEILGNKELWFRPDTKNIAPTLDKDEYHLWREKIWIVHDPKAAVLWGIAWHAWLFATAWGIATIARLLINDFKWVDNLFHKSTLDKMLQSFWSQRVIWRGLNWVSKELHPDFSDITIYHTWFTWSHLIIDLNNDLYAIMLCNRTYQMKDIDLKVRVNERFWDNVKSYISLQSK